MNANKKDTAHFATQSPKRTSDSLYKYKSPTAENMDCNSRGALVYETWNKGNKYL
jgi:hypothetical protein